MISRKRETRFVCANCGYESVGWLGKCPNCGEWETLVEEIISPTPRGEAAAPKNLPIRLADISMTHAARSETGIREFDRVLGGGVVQGSLILIGGDPGIGKSTLLLQSVSHLAKKGKRVLYASGEESPEQTKLRAERLGVEDQNLYVLSETNIESILEAVSELKPDIVVVDSIQTVYHPALESAPGTVGQVRECGGVIMRAAKSTSRAFMVIGHVTKGGAIAGPKTLEHLVDTVLYLEGDVHHHFRILRAVKNRFGSTNEIGVFEMASSGLREVPNPSEAFLSERSGGSPGAVVTCAIEGSRPVLVEVQALVSRANFGLPQRVATGTDQKRLAMLLAVLERRSGFKISDQDIFCNVAGGLRIDETAVDLAVVAALASNFRDRPIAADTVVVGEVGLSGEIRRVRQIERRAAEAKRLGFRRCVCSAADKKEARIRDFETVGAADVNDALDLLSL
jgi:DNA repair protein RadA/Sms